jgi:thiol:disulfide interchange protein DsbC
MLRSTQAILLGALFAAGTACGADTATPKAADPTIEGPGSAAVARLRELRPDLPVESATPSPIPGFVTIELTGGTMLYASEDGRFLFAGDLYEMRDEGLVNLADARRNVLRRELMAAVPDSEMAIFPATGTRKAAIAVFTDVDCGFCRKLHLEVPDLNARGIEVRYLAFPRQGIDSEAYLKLVSAWCSADRNDAITRLKRGETIPVKTCKNPVERQYALGHQVGVEGTPAIVFEDGSLHPGYSPAADLAKRLGL